MKTLEQLYQSKTFTKKEIDCIIDNWNHNISRHRKLSEAFIEKFQDKLDWYRISVYHKLSMRFIEKFKDKVDWYYISSSQKLSEKFIEKHKYRVNWTLISAYQKLSEAFIEKHEDKINWSYVSYYQKLSEAFIKKHRYKINKNLIPNQVDNRSYEEKLANITAYANHYNLKLENDYLYCYREHDYWNRGIFSGTIFYDKPGKYTDWKCDLNPANEASYGLGVFPQGNTPIRVHVKDWGVWIKKTNKGRVWAFEKL